MKPQIENLIILSPGFPKDEDDTVCLPAQQRFVKTLNRIYPEIRVIILSLQYPLHNNEYVWHGNRVIPFNALSYWKPFRPLLWRRVGRRLEQIVDNKSTALLSFWLADTALIGNRFARRHNVRHMCWIMGQDARRKNPYARLTRIEEQELIALSDFLADEFFRNYAKRPARIIPLGVDTTAFEPNTAAERAIDVLGVGSLIPLKRYDIFVDIIAVLKQNHPTIRAVLCGRGPEEPRIREKICALDLQRNITVAGEVSHGKVLSMMQQSRLLLHPAEYEGYSSACLEALYAGCHVISFTRPEARDIRHWHVVATVEDMCAKASALISHQDYAPVLVHNMEDSLREVMSVLDSNPNSPPSRKGYH